MVYEIHLSQEMLKGLGEAGIRSHFYVAPGVEIVIHAPPKNECECGAMGGAPHEFGEPENCEHHDHHCEACHERGICTAAECLKKELP